MKLKYGFFLRLTRTIMNQTDTALSTNEEGIHAIEYAKMEPRNVSIRESNKEGILTLH